MPKRKRGQEIIVLEQEGESSLKWMLVGGLLGAGLALLLAPATGEETRDQLVRKARKLKLSAEDTIDEIQERFDAFRGSDADEEELEEALDDDLDAEDDVEEDDESIEETDEVVDLPKARLRVKRTRKKRSGISQAREELERRLEAARAKRRDNTVEDQEQDA